VRFNHLADCRDANWSKTVDKSSRQRALADTVGEVLNRSKGIEEEEMRVFRGIIGVSDVREEPPPRRIVCVTHMTCNASCHAPYDTPQNSLARIENHNTRKKLFGSIDQMCFFAPQQAQEKSFQQLQHIGQHAPR